MTNSGRAVRGKETDKAHLKLSAKRRERGPKKKNQISETVSQASTSDWTDVEDCNGAAGVAQSGSSGGNVGNASHHSFAASSQEAYCKYHRAASVNSMSSDGLNSSCAMDLETMNLCEEDLLKTPNSQEQSHTEHGGQKRYAPEESTEERTRVSPNRQHGREAQREKRTKFSSDPGTDGGVQMPQVNPELSNVEDSTLHTQLHSSRLSASLTQSESSGSCRSFLAKMNLKENDLMSDISETNEESDDTKEKMTLNTEPKTNAEPGSDCDEREGMEYERAQSNDDTYTEEEYLDDEDEESEVDEPAENVQFDPNYHTPEEYWDWLDAQKNAYSDSEEPEDDFAAAEEYRDYEYIEDDSQNEECKAPDENLTEEETPAANSDTSNKPKRTRNIRNPFGKRFRNISVQYDVHEQEKAFCRSKQHRFDDCNFLDTVLIDAKRDGLETAFIIKCEKCDLIGIIFSELPNVNYMSLNYCFVLGIHHIGKAYAALEEICAHIGLHGMDSRKYQDISQEIDDHHAKLSKKIMEENRAEERRLAIEAKCISEDEVPFTEVYGDGRWSIRTYGKKGVRSQSCSAVLIGAQSKKVLYADTKNKYCLGCNRGKAPGEHKCNRTWPENKSILAAEGEIILEGFKSTLDTTPNNRLRFLRYIGDRDSNTYKKVKDADVYSGILIGKGSCVLHIKRARIDEIMQITSKFKTTVKGFEGRENERKALKEYLKTLPPRIGKDVTSSANYWRQQDNPDEDKCKNIAKDVNNIFHHIFGDHKQCDPYFCRGNGASDDKYSIDDLKTHNLYDPLQLVMGKWSLDSEDLLRGQTTNLAESFNAQISRYTDHKAVNYQQKSALTARVHLAVIEDSTKAGGSRLHEELGFVPPQTLLEFEQKRRAKNESNKKCVRKRRIRGAQFAETENLTQSPDYGSHPAQEDMASEVYENASQLHDNLLNRWQSESEEIEQKTRGRIEEEYLYRTKLLFSEAFGDVCRRRNTTPTAPLVKQILYPPVKKTANEQYQKIRQEQLKKVIPGMRECGVIVDRKEKFLATKPFGLINDDTIVKVYTPYEMSQGNVDEAFKKNKCEVLKLLKRNKDGSIIVNRNNKTYYDIIGALAITGKEFCRVFIASSEDFIGKTINRDDDCWNKNIGKLKSFYEDHLLPEIIDSRHKRNMKLRDAERLKGSNVNFQPAKPHESSNSRDNTKNKPKHEHIPADDDDDFNGQSFTASGLQRKHLIPLFNSEWLQDDHIDNFGSIVMHATDKLYVQQSPLFVQQPEIIEAINPMRKHIQILHNGNNHWVCAFWNTKKIILYDSLPEMKYGNNIMPEEEIPKSYREYLSKLLPEYDFSQGIEYPVIQNQGNDYDCGVFAIAVFVSLLYGLEPVMTQLRYDQPQMRPHLRRIYEQNSLQHFPLESGCPVRIPNLYEVLQREREQ